jgi:cytoskeleton protein RodZ
MMRAPTASRLKMREYPNEGKTRAGSFGERLRREREMRGVSLDDIADATKIGTRLLRALEDEHFEQLPGGIFNKGFVRAYAKYLGLNEEEAVADYLDAAGETAPDPRLIAEQNSTRIDRSGGDSSDSRQAGFPIVPVLILLLVIAAGAGGWQIYQDRQRDREAKREAAKSVAVTTPPAVASPEASNSTTVASPSAQPGAGATKTEATNGTATAPANPAGRESTPLAGSTDLNAPASKTADSTSNGQATPPPEIAKPNPQEATGPGSSQSYSTATSGQYFEVTVRAKDSAWVSIKSDGKFMVRGIIKPPDVKRIRANDQVVFFTGNAGAVEVSFNGQPVSLVGGPNQEGVLVFNAHGAMTPKPAQ